MLAAALSGLDAFVFTAGIGENSPGVRARITDKLRCMCISCNGIASGRLPPSPSSSICLFA
jgi:acetate kinase